MRIVQLAGLVFLSSSAAWADDTGDTGVEPVPANPNFIVLADMLDEAPDMQHYCADVAGSDVKTGTHMQAHTCKVPTDDELFTTNSPKRGNIYVTDHDMCITAESIAIGSELIVKPCRTTSATQIWQSTIDGKIQPRSDASLCWTVDTKIHGHVAGAMGDHLKRVLTLQVCDDFDDKYNTWILPGGFVGSEP
jgi:Ricin-type beta-trefoil lectin domain